MAPSETAWAHRDARYIIGFHGSWKDPAAYGAHAARLVETKRRYHPYNLFCLNANAEPDAAP